MDETRKGKKNSNYSKPNEQNSFQCECNYQQQIHTEHAKWLGHTKRDREIITIIIMNKLTILDFNNLLHACLSV